MGIDGGNDTRKLISIIVPTYNESEGLHEFHRRVSAVMADLPYDYELIFINDGSRDDTLAILKNLRGADPHVAVVDLSRNFGKEIALTAGIDCAHGHAVVAIDADLQDPPELIREFVRYWEEGYETVFGQRAQRYGETWLKKATAHIFYRLVQRTTRIEIPADTGDFRLISRKVVDALKELREQHRFMKGLFAWVGFSQKAVIYGRDPRFAGTTKWNYWRLWNFAIEGFTSFTVAPLKVATYFGIAIAVAAFSFGAFIIYKTLAYGDSVAGYPSLMVTVLFIGGVQLLALGIIGEYLGRVFNEAKQRPLYFVNEWLPAPASGASEDDRPTFAQVPSGSERQPIGLGRRS